MNKPKVILPEGVKTANSKKPVCVFVIADQNNFKYAVTMLKTFRHFHDWPVVLVTNEVKKEELDKLPDKIELVDLNAYLEDPFFFYRATPIIAEPLLDKYELVIKLDADQLILGDLNYILETKDYDIGTVINANRVDPMQYGWVELGRIGISPIEYFNCGFVAMRSPRFVHNWLVDCFTPQFERMQYREQDILNILCYFGNYNVRCFDHGDGVRKYNAWHGLIAKGECARAYMQGDKVIIPKGLGETPFPPNDMELKVLHLGGGAGAPKDNWGAYLPPEVMDYVNKLLV